MRNLLIYITLSILVAFPNWFHAQQPDSTVSVQSKFDLGGQISFQSNLYFANGIDPRQDPFAWSTNGRLNLSYMDKISIPISWTIGRYGSRLDYPSFRQFGLSPKYKWATFHLGHRNVTFSPQTLAGTTFFGLGAELQPKSFRFSFIHGKLRNAREELIGTNALPSYSIRMNTFKIGVGNKDTFFDLIWLQAEDLNVPTSIQEEVFDTLKLRPAQNTVLGFASKFKFSDKWRLTINGAGSAFSRDKDAPEPESSIFDNYALGANNFLFTPLRTTRFNFAGNGVLSYNSKKFKVGFNYEYIEPEYRSLGAYYFNTDIFRWTFRPALKMFKNKMNLSGSYGRQRNNLLDNRSETTHRNVGAVRLNYQITKSLNFMANYSNFSIFQRSGNIALNDTVAFNLETKSLQLMPRLFIQRKTKLHIVGLMFLNQESIHQQSETTLSDQGFKSSSILLDYTINWKINNVSLTFGLNRNQFETNFVNTDLSGASISLSLPITQNKLNLRLGLNATANKLNEKNNGNSTMISSDLSYTPSKKDQFSFLLYSIIQRPIEGEDFSETRIDLRYSHNF